MAKTPIYSVNDELNEVLRKLRAEEGLVENVLSVAKLLIDARRADMTGSFTLHFTRGALRRIRTELWSTVEEMSPDS
jgi:hypothetical protein